jgi:hypothetical protein
MPDTIETLLKQNLHAVFGERDPIARRAVIASIWSEDGIFIDPNGKHVGHAALDEAVAQLYAQFPDFVFSELSPAQAFHDIGRLAWGFGPPNHPPTVTGLDVVVVTKNRLSALYTFLDPSPQNR